ncbi:MAG: prolipoprotein diacylglyceryl transferase [Acidobacteria bacterium]|nr:MAG: prolipoprotein diacylglyceryl transferase [Acidobacteriota bacterium]
MRRVFMQWLVAHGLSPWIVPNYWFMLCLSLIVGSLLTIRLWRRAGQAPETARNLLFWGIPSLLVGAKLLYLAQFGIGEWYGWRSGGASLYGGLVGLLAAWLVYYAFRPYPVFLFLDTATPGLALGLFLTRIGCFLNGCNGGHVTGLPWGVAFPAGTNVFSVQLKAGQIPAACARSLPVHPTQLYESLFGLGCFFLLFRLVKRPEFDGHVFLTGMLWYSTYRFITEFLRADNGGVRPFGVLTFAQMVSLVLFACALVLLLSFRRRPIPPK